MGRICMNGIIKATLHMPGEMVGVKNKREEKAFQIS